MACALTTPWWRTRAADPERSADGGTGVTPVLDHDHASVVALLASVRATAPATDRDLVRAAHTVVAEQVAAGYAVDDARSASWVLRRGRGSCSQRMAVVEAVARAAGIATRTHGLVVDGGFWYPRFPAVTVLVPSTVVLAWPEFDLDGTWVPIDQLFDVEVSGGSMQGFVNAGAETLFDAVGRTVVDWTGRTSGPGCSACDLSHHVVTDLGRFDSRDDLFDRHGQTMSATVRPVADLVLRRWRVPTA